MRPSVANMTGHEIRKARISVTAYWLPTPPYLYLMLLSLISFLFSEPYVREVRRTGWSEEAQTLNAAKAFAAMPK